MPGLAAAARSAHAAARPAAREAWRGLIQVLVGPDPAPARRWRSPRQRGMAYAAVSVAALGLCAVSLATMKQGLYVGIGPAQLEHLAGSAGWRLLAVAVVVPVPLAVRYPLLGWRIGWLALILTPLVTRIQWGSWPGDQAQVPVLLVVFCVAGVRYQRPVLWWMWALTLIPWWLWIGPGPSRWPGSAAATILFTATAIAVDSLSSRWRAQRTLAAQNKRIELEQARGAVLRERTRIARELHDVVAHHMSLIAVRTETAPYRLSGLPGPVRAEFQALSGEARAALADMRRLLGVLRDDQPAALAPQPQLSELPMLIDAARRAGVLVELSVPTGLDQVPAGVGVCAYRIVQESLSNASRHAPGSAVTVSVDQEASTMLLRVANGPGGPAGVPGGGRRPGHGLVGMRERVALLGGSLSAGPAPDGGFVVSAVLPFGETA
jgi:signal transduction histidine kinase